jgi:pimeloyl-ACP methyl ester carboxylesterase
MSYICNIALPFVDQILSKQLNICTFDFSGTGLSQGHYVSLGFHEKYDVSAVLDHLSNKFNIKHFYLWGRSMGAVAAVKYLSMMTNPSTRESRSHKDYKINGLILDSPFQSLRELTIQLAK